MKILALERELPGATAERFHQFAKAEARAAWDLHQAVLMLECASEDEAAGVLARLPFVQAGLITFDLIPLVAYPGFERLFA